MKYCRIKKILSAYFVLGTKYKYFHIYYLILSLK